MVCDIAQAAERQRLCAWALAEAPQLNVLINNAGIQRQVSLAHPPDDWAATAGEIAINLEAPVHLVLLLSRHLQQQAAPLIVNVSSGLGFVPLAGVPVYSATKAALHAFTLALRRQLAATPVRVVEVIPPAVHTELGGTDHSFGVPLADYADDVMQQLAAGHAEVTSGFSAQGSQASRAELDAMFNHLNGGKVA